MKRAYVILLALLFLMSGCSGNAKTKDVSVKDVCCPYEITHKKAGVEITLEDGNKSGILWKIEVLPNDLCEITQKNSGKEFVSRYLIAGKREGASQLVFSGEQPDGTVTFVLTLLVDVDAKGKTVVSTCWHQERQSASVETDGLNYKWSVELDGSLIFSFINEEDKWLTDDDGSDVCIFTNMMSTPAGCKFTAQANRAGQTTVVLTGVTTQRKIEVVVAVDEAGGLEILSVQER